MGRQRISKNSTINEFVTCFSNLSFISIINHKALKYIVFISPLLLHPLQMAYVFGKNKEKIKKRISSNRNLEILKHKENRKSAS